jgi:hypothetical protein
MDDQMRMNDPQTPGQKMDRLSFAPGLNPGDLMDTHMTPVIWRK